MDTNAAHQFLRVVARADNQFAVAAELGCSKWSVSNRMSKVRALFGDAEVLALLNKYAAEAGITTVRVRLDNKKSQTCTKCGADKVASPTSGKLVCLTCANLNNQAYRERYPDKIKAANAAYYVENRDVMRAKHRAYYAENQPAIRAYHAARRAANPGIEAAYYRANAERIKARARAYRAANADKVALYFRALDQTPARRAQNRVRLSAWKKAHPDRVNADTAKRQLILRQAYVSWADDDIIQEAYTLARMRTLATGIPWQVDHIVPLNSDMVCGLHWEGNLQVIPAVVNLAKSNDWWPDMPAARRTWLPSPRDRRRIASGRQLPIREFERKVSHARTYQLRASFLRRFDGLRYPTPT